MKCSNGRCERLDEPGDAVLAISTSGNSANVLRGVAAALEIGIRTIGLTGRTGGRLASMVEVPLVVEAESTQHIQETHITVGHILCELVEESLFGNEHGSKDPADSV